MAALWYLLLSVEVALPRLPGGQNTRDARTHGSHTADSRPDDEAASGLQEAVSLSRRSISDTAEWDFRRKQVRRNSRSAQEWVRDTADTDPVPPWSESLLSYPSANGFATTQHRGE